MSLLYPKEKILVSACLLGEKCRYDGQTKDNPSLLLWLEDKEVIPFCPEHPLFGTPRPPIALASNQGMISAKRCHDKLDVTQMLKAETLSVVASNEGVKHAILKSKSPSCGCGTTPVYDSKGKCIGLDDGIAASVLKKHCYTIHDENNYRDTPKDKRC